MSKRPRVSGQFVGGTFMMTRATPAEERRKGSASAPLFFTISYVCGCGYRASTQTEDLTQRYFWPHNCRLVK